MAWFMSTVTASIQSLASPATLERRIEVPFDSPAPELSAATTYAGLDAQDLMLAVVRRQVRMVTRLDARRLVATFRTDSRLMINSL